MIDRRLVCGCLTPVFYYNLRRGVVAMPIDSNHGRRLLSQFTDSNLDVAILVGRCHSSPITGIPQPRADLASLVCEARGGIKDDTA